MSHSPLMQVAVCADANYLRHALVMLRSLLDWHQADALCVHLILGPDVEAGLEPGVGDLCRQGLDLRLHRISADTQARLPVHKLFGRGAWYRLLLPDLLADVERVLYLDCDLIVCDTLRPLWNTELNGALVAAAVNPLHPHLDRGWLRQLGPLRASAYFNSGVMLMDLMGMRREHWQDRFISCVERASVPLRFADQDVLNALLRERCVSVPRRYNLQSVYFDLFPFELGMTSAGLRELLSTPAVVHFTAPDKPWNLDSAHPGRALYRHYAELRPNSAPALDLTKLRQRRLQYHRRALREVYIRLTRRVKQGIGRRYAALAKVLARVSRRTG